MATGVNRVVTSFLGATPRTIVIAGSPYFTTARNYQGGGLIPYTELIDGPQETISNESMSASKVVEVEWGRRREFLITMRGVSYPIGYPVAQYLVRIAPQPYSLDYPRVYCTGGDLLMGRTNPRPTNVTTLTSQDCGDLAFDVARFRLNYQALKYNVTSNVVAANGIALQAAPREITRWVERECHHSADNIPVPSGSFRWVTAPNNAIQEGGVPLVFASRQLVWVWHDVPEVCMAAIRYRIAQTLGRVNSVPFDALPGLTGRGYPTGTLLLIGADEEELPINGQGLPFVLSYRSYKIKFTALYRNNGFSGNPSVFWGWNHLFRGYSYTPAFQLVRAPLPGDGSGAPTGSTIYRYADFYSLFDVFGLGLPV